MIEWLGAAVAIIFTELAGNSLRVAARRPPFSPRAEINESYCHSTAKVSIPCTQGSPCPVAKISGSQKSYIVSLEISSASKASSWALSLISHRRYELVSLSVPMRFSPYSVGAELSEGVAVVGAACPLKSNSVNLLHRPGKVRARSSPVHLNDGRGGMGVAWGNGFTDQHSRVENVCLARAKSSTLVFFPMGVSLKLFRFLPCGGPAIDVLVFDDQYSQHTLFPENAH